MKFTTNKIDKKPEPKNKYPFFGRVKKHVGSGVVLFTKSGTGMVVEKIYPNIHDVGFIFSSWRMEAFEKIENYSVTISTD
jgi:hypothetical protein